MRFKILGALVASMLSASVSAAGYTYTIKGQLDRYTGFGDNMGALAAALGQPTTFELTFAIPTLTPAGHPSFEPASSFFAQTSATLKLDGVTRFTSGLNPSGINLLVGAPGQGQTLSFGMGTAADFVPEIAGPENFTAIVSLNFPSAAFSQDQLPSGDIVGLATGGWVSVALSNLPVGSQFASLAEATTSSASLPVTSITVTPAPEPGEWAMMAGGLGIVGAVARRRRKG